MPPVLTSYDDDPTFSSLRSLTSPDESVCTVGALIPPAGVVGVPSGGPKGLSLV